MKASFEYGGYHFTPVGKLSGAGAAFDAISKHLRSDRELGISSYDWGLRPYSHASFYTASPVKDADLFQCEENGRLYLPGEHELFHYEGAEYEPIFLKAEDGIVIIPAPQESLSLTKHRAFYIRGGKHLYHVHTGDNLEMEGLKSVDAQTYFTNLLLQKSLSQLEQYLEEHLSDFSMYKKESFWDKALYYAGRMVFPGTPYALMNNIGKGIVDLYVLDPFYRENPYRCIYDFVREELLLRYSDRKADMEKPAQDFMGYLYHGDQQYILAQRQNDMGIIPSPYREAYQELARINNFLKGKQTVQLWFQNGKKLPCYPRDIQTAAFLFRIQDGKIVTYPYNYRLDADKENPIRLDVEDGLPIRLSHYSQEIKVDTAVLEQLQLLSPAEEKQTTTDQQRQEKSIRLLQECEGGIFYRIVLYYQDGCYQEFYGAQAVSSPASLLRYPAIRDRLLEYYEKGQNAFRVCVSQFCLGKYSDRPLPQAAIQAFERIRLKNWQNQLPLTEKSLPDISVDEDFLFEHFAFHPRIFPDKRESLIIRKLLRTPPAGVVWLFSVVEINRQRTTVIAGHPRSRDEVYSLECVQKFLREHPEESYLEVQVCRRFFGRGENFQLMDPTLLKLFYGLSLESQAFEEAFPACDETVLSYEYFLKEAV